MPKPEGQGVSLTTYTYFKRRDVGLAGLALLRTWLTEDAKSVSHVIDELSSRISDLTEQPNAEEGAQELDLEIGYQTWSETYDVLPNLLMDIEWPITSGLIKHANGSRALDAACGTGRYSSLLASLGHQVLALDQSGEMLRRSNEKNHGAELIQGELTALPLRDHSVDLVVCALSLAHLADLSPAVSEFARVLVRGGHVIISDVHPLLVTLGFHADFWDASGRHAFVRNYQHWHGEYLETFARNNLKVIQCQEPTVDFQLKPTLLSKDHGASLVHALDGIPVALIWLLELQN